MAKAKKQANTVQIQLAGAEVDDAGEDWDYRAAIQQIEQQDGARFQVTRIAPKEFHGYVGELLPAEFSAQSLLERFGPGVYRIRAIGPDNLYIPGGGRMTIGPQSGAKPVSASTQPTTATDIASVLVQLDERRSREAREQTDKWLRWTAILGPIVSPLLAKLIGGNAVADVVGLVAKLKELEPKHSSDLDVFLRALDYAHEHQRDGGGEGETWLGFARDALDTVRPAVAGFFANPTPAAAITARASASVPPTVPSPAALPIAPTSVGSAPAATSASPTPGLLSNGSNPMYAHLLKHLPWFRGTLAQLIYQAKQSKNPALYAEVVLDNLPTDLEPQELYHLLAQDNWWPALQQLAPDVSHYEGWFSMFREEVMHMMARDVDRSPSKPDSAPIESESDPQS